MPDSDPVPALHFCILTCGVKILCSVLTEKAQGREYWKARTKRPEGYWIFWNSG